MTGLISVNLTGVDGCLDDSRIHKMGAIAIGNSQGWNHIIAVVIRLRWLGFGRSLVLSDLSRWPLTVAGDFGRKH
jgi:hypothetical protein